MSNEKINEWIRTAPSGSPFTAVARFRPDPDEPTVDDAIRLGRVECADECKGVRAVTPDGIMAACPACEAVEVDLRATAALLAEARGEND